MKPSLHEIVESAQYNENIEVIELPWEGERMALLRTKQMAELAFLIWVQKHTSTYSQIVFKTEKKVCSCCGQKIRVRHEYSVVCACCPSETYGVEMPEGENQEDWKNRMAKKFADTIAGACQQHDIETIFMRYAEAWKRRYDDLRGLQIVEAVRHTNSYRELYGRKTIREELRFIDYDKSEGLQHC